VSLPQQVAELKTFRNLFITGEAKVEIVRAANVVIEEVHGTVTIKPAGDAVFQIEPTGTAVFTVKAEAGYFYVRTESGVALTIEPSSTAVFNVKAEAGYFYVRTESGVALTIEPSSTAVFNVKTEGTYIYVRTESGVALTIEPSDTAVFYIKNTAETAIFIQNTSGTAIYIKNESTSPIYITNTSTSPIYITNEESSPIYIQTASDVEIRITVVNASIALPIDIQATTIALAIDIQATTIALPVDIQAQTINLKIDIAAQSIDLIKIDIANASIGRLDVNIYNTEETAIYIQTAPGSKLDINIVESEAHVMIVNPSGIPVYTGETGNTVFHDWSASNFSGTAYIEDVSGYRGRFLRYIFDIAFDSPVPPSELDLIYLTVVLDGFAFQLRLTWIASLNGMIHVTKATSNAWVHADFLSEGGGLTAVLFDESGKIKRVIGIWEIQHEFEDSWEIRFMNNSSSNVDVTVRYEVSYYL